MKKTEKIIFLIQNLINIGPFYKAVWPGNKFNTNKHGPMFILESKVTKYFAKKQHTYSKEIIVFCEYT